MGRRKVSKKARVGGVIRWIWYNTSTATAGHQVPLNAPPTHCGPGPSNLTDTDTSLWTGTRQIQTAPAMEALNALLGVQPKWVDQPHTPGTWSNEKSIPIGTNGRCHGQRGHLFLASRRGSRLRFTFGLLS